MAKAEKGDLIRITNAKDHRYSNGEIFEVAGRSEKYGFSTDGVMTETEILIYDHEYEIFRKACEEDPPNKAEIDVQIGGTWNGGYDLSSQDAVEHPNHYTQGRFETIEVIEQFTSGYDDGFVAHCVGTATKYIARAPYKHETPLEDLRKAAKYLEFAIGRLTQNERN